MAKNVAISTGLAAHALELAKPAASNELLQKELNEFAESREKAARGPVWIYFALRTALGEEPFQALPSPTPENDEDSKSNNPYRRKVTQNGKDVVVDFYKVFCMEGQPTGIHIADTLEQIKLAQDNETRDEAGEPWSKMTLPMLRASENKWKQRASAVVSVTKRAVLLRDQINSIKTHLPNVKVQFAMDSSKNLLSTTTPIIVREDGPEANPDNYRTLSVGQFLNLKVSKAVANGGTWEALLGTIKRKKKGEETTEWPELESIDDMDELSAVFANAVGTPVWHKRIADALDKDDSDDFLLSLDTIRNELDDILTRTKYAKRIEELREAEKNGEAVAA